MSSPLWKLHHIHDFLSQIPLKKTAMVVKHIFVDCVIQNQVKLPLRLRKICKDNNLTITLESLIVVYM